jgi:Raf kinase inhibitor-like YbhB/YbcL family protein
MQIISSSFSNHQHVPPQYTCKGTNISPPFEFLDVPGNTMSFVLIVEDLDSSNHWIHWLVYNIPGHIRQIEEGKLPAEAVDGICNGGTHGYEGPCPVYFAGEHHYAFRLYALDVKLDAPFNADKNVIAGQMKGHIIATAELIGLAQGEKQENVMELNC